jgi:hypothetical protein
MSAASTVQASVEEWSFEVADVLPYVPSLVFGAETDGGLVGLLRQVELPDSKAMVLRIIRSVIERVGGDVCSQGEGGNNR